MITIELPWPDKRLSPNARVNRYEKAKVKAEARQIGKIVTLESLEQVTLNELEKLWGIMNFAAQYLFHPPDRRHRDIDNCLSMCKSYQDGVCDALRINDKLIKRTVLEWGEVVKGGKVVLRLSDLGEIRELEEME